MQQLIQLGFNTAAVHSVAFALNNAARSLPSDQHQWSSHLTGLQTHVENCASECGFRGSVKVLMLEQSSEQPATAEAAPSRCSMSGDGSFTTLVGRLKSDTKRRERRQAATPPPVDYKLSLAFVDREARSGWVATRPSSSPPAARALSNPISYSSLSFHIMQESSSDLLDQVRTRELSRRTNDSGNVSVISWFHEHTTNGPAARMLVRLFLGILVCWDITWLLVLSWLILLLSNKGFFIWILIPPFAPLLAAILNVLLVLLDRPQLGRFAVSLTGFSLRNLACFVAYRAVFVESCCFDLLVVALAGMVKAALILCAHSHCLNVEAARDLGFSKVSKLPRFERKASRSDTISTTRTMSAFWPSFSGRPQGPNTVSNEGISLAAVTPARDASFQVNSSAEARHYTSAISHHAAPF